MERAPWGILLVLLGSPGGTSLEKDPGQLCYTWTPEFAIFWCPEAHNQPNATFCCGTCQHTYCCPSEEDHLDQRLCRRYSIPDPPPVPHIRYYLLLFLGVFLLMFSTICAGGVALFSNTIRAFWGQRRSSCGCDREQEIQLVPRQTRRTHSTDTYPDSAHLSSLGAEDHSGSEVLPHAWDASGRSEDLPPSWEITYAQIHHESQRESENEAFNFFYADLPHRSVSCPVLEVVAEGGDLSGLDRDV